MADFKSYIEEVMDLKERCTIQFRSVEGAVSEISARIISMENAGGRDILDTDAGFSIGLDQIISINGRTAENYC